MQYPLISEYVKAIQDAGDNLDKLSHLTPVLDDHGEPYRSSGAFAVVFKMQDKRTGKYYALKCFTEEQQGRAEAYRQIADELDLLDSPYITSVKYMEKELFVDSQCEEDEFPVLLMDWVEGGDDGNLHCCKLPESVSHVDAELSFWQDGGLAPYPVFFSW